MIDLARPREVAPGLSLFSARTPTLPPATHTNSYALGGREIVLIEPATPYADEQKEWLAWAKSLRLNGGGLKAIVPTHHHPDHVGGIDVLARELDVPIWAHEETAKRVQAPVDRFLNDGDEIVLDGPTPQRWKALLTPGHAPGHLCFHEPEINALVVGDMVASIGTILIAPGEGHMGTYLAQLSRLATIGAGVGLPAHGDPIATPTTLFERYIAHRLLREQKVKRALEAFGESGATLSELVPTAYDDTPKEIWTIAELSLAAHLEKLVEEGAVRQVEHRYTVAIA